MATYDWEMGLAAATAANAATANAVFIALEYAIDGASVGNEEDYEENESYEAICRGRGLKMERKRKRKEWDGGRDERILEGARS